MEYTQRRGTVACSAQLGKEKGCRKEKDRLSSSLRRVLAMNSAFKAATGQYLAYKNIAETLSHNQRVTRLYRVRARALCSLLYAAPPPTDPCRGGALIINSHPPLSPSYRSHLQLMNRHR